MEDIIKGKNGATTVKQFNTKHKSKAAKEKPEELIPNFKESKLGQQFSFNNMDRYQSCQLKQQAMALLVPGHINFLFNH
jgi:hypothetical protein